MFCYDQARLLHDLSMIINIKVLMCVFTGRAKQGHGKGLRAVQKYLHSPLMR